MEDRMGKKTKKDRPLMVGIVVAVVTVVCVKE